MKLNEDFFNRDCLEVAPDLVGKLIVRKLDDNSYIKMRITQTEAYRGEDDKACHASKGKTNRTQTMYMAAGTIYVYICYGIHYLMNIVTEKEGIPQAVLIRCCEDNEGPAKLTKSLFVDKSFNGESIIENSKIWLESDGYQPLIKTAPRVGIDYAGEEWKNKPWRYIDINLSK